MEKPVFLRTKFIQDSNLSFAARGFFLCLADASQNPDPGFVYKQAESSHQIEILFKELRDAGYSYYDEEKKQICYRDYKEGDE